MINSFEISSAYNCLSHLEREAVDNFIQAVRIHAERNNELIIHSLNRQIPPDIVARSRGQLEKPLVRSAIYDKILELSNEQDLSAQRILREHLILAMSNMSDYLKFDSLGVMTVSLANCTREQMAAVKKITVKHGLFGTQTSLELHSKQLHLETLGKMMGLEKEDNPTLQRHLATPQDIKPLPITANIQDAEKAYIDLLEAIK